MDSGIPPPPPPTPRPLTHPHRQIAGADRLWRIYSSPILLTPLIAYIYIIAAAARPVTALGLGRVVCNLLQSPSSCRTRFTHPAHPDPRPATVSWHTETVAFSSKKYTCLLGMVLRLLSSVTLMFFFSFSEWIKISNCLRIESRSQK